MIDLFYRDQTPPIQFLLIIGSFYEIIEGEGARRPLGTGKEAFHFRFPIINYLKNKTNGEKPAIGIEPMTIALQMRCSNL